MKSVNFLIKLLKNSILNNDNVIKKEISTNKLMHREDKECSYCIDTDNKIDEKINELNKIKIVQPHSSSLFNRSDDSYHLFRPQDSLNSYDSSLIMRNVDKCKGTNENIKNSKRIQLYKNKGDISNFNTTIRTNLNKFKIDLSKDLRYKFLNKYDAEDDFNFDIYIFPPPAGVIPDGYSQRSINSNGTITYTKNIIKTIKSYSPPKFIQKTDDRGYYWVAEGGHNVSSSNNLNQFSYSSYNAVVTYTFTYTTYTYKEGTSTLIYNMKTSQYSTSESFGNKTYENKRSISKTATRYMGSTSGP